MGHPGQRLHKAEAAGEEISVRCRCSASAIEGDAAARHTEPWGSEDRASSLKAREEAIKTLVRDRGPEATASFIEVESGKSPDWLELTKALQRAGLNGATLSLAEVDRLSRNAGFLLTLRDSGVRLIEADLPEANAPAVGIMALVAQQER